MNNSNKSSPRCETKELNDKANLPYSNLSGNKKNSACNKQQYKSQICNSISQREDFNNKNRKSCNLNVNNTMTEENFENYETANINNRADNEHKAEVYSNKEILKLRQKVKEQASRLQKLVRYKELCEAKIASLDPSQQFTFPEFQQDLAQESLRAQGNTESVHGMGFNRNIINSNADFNQIEINYQLIIKKYEQEIFNLNNKINLLNQELKIQNSLTHNPIKNLTNNINSINFQTNNPPSFTNRSINFNNNSNNISQPLSVDKIKNEKLREAYNNIYILYNNYIAEKNELLESLKIETLNNEEQKNYIEILRQTIESFINKNSFANVLNQLKKDFYERTNLNSNISKVINLPSHVEFLSEITKQKLDLEKCRKELILSQALISELRKENEILNSNNLVMTSTKNKLVENLESEIKDLDQAKIKLKLFETENENLIKENELIRSSYDKLKNDLKLANVLAAKYENSLKESNNKQEELKLYIEKAQVLENKILEFQTSLEKLHGELSEAHTAKNALAEALGKSQVELENKTSEIEDLKKQLLIIQAEKNNFLSDKEVLNKQILLLEKFNTELKNALQDKELDLTIHKERIQNFLKDQEYKKSEIYIKYQSLENEFFNYKVSSQKIIETQLKETEDLKQLLRNNNINNNNAINGTSDFNSNNISLTRNIEISRKAAYEKNRNEAFSKMPDYIISNSASQAVLMNEKDKENNELYSKFRILENDLCSKVKILEKLTEQYDKLTKDNKALEDSYRGLAAEKDFLIKENIAHKNRFDTDMLKKMNEVQNLNKEHSDLVKQISIQEDTIKQLKQYKIKLKLFLIKI